MEKNGAIVNHHAINQIGDRGSKSNKREIKRNQNTR